MLVKKSIAEALGTFVLVVFGCGSAVAANTLLGSAGQGVPLAYSTLLIAFAFGLVIVAMAYSIGNISGCHINPAVSLAMLVSKKMSAKDFCGYVIAQVLGAILGALALGLIFGFDCGFGANAPQFANNHGVITSLCAEVALTFIFVLTILGVTSRDAYSKVAGLVIGGALTLVHLLGIALTGTSVNPARSLGPALFAGGDALKYVWIFILAPLAGGCLAAIAWNILDKKDN